MTNDTITLQALVERRLAEAAVADPSVLGRFAADPESVVRPILAEVLGDDGELALDALTTSVHVNTRTHLHFVVNLDDVVGEVAGFADVPEIGSFGSMLSSTAIDASSLGEPDSIFKRTRNVNRCATSGGTCLTRPPGCTPPPL